MMDPPLDVESPSDVRVALARAIDPGVGPVGRRVVLSGIAGPKGLGETKVEIGAVGRGRVTGYGVACEVHGAMPVLAPNRAKAVGAAGRHLSSEHGGKGRIVDRARLAGRRR